MYNINHNHDLNILEIKDSNQLLCGEIHLNDGASLQKLSLNETLIIQDLSPLKYKDTYASSILFPFANRIKDGNYTFNGKNYQFEINQKEENNALHGIVYNKTFKVINIETNNDSAMITLEYIEKNRTIGFPFTYSIQLKYVFKKDILSLVVVVKNTGSEAFPYTIGWHPYFLSDNLQNSNLSFDSKQKLIIGERNIATGIEEIKVQENLEIKDKKLDDCWALNSNKIKFNTPKYQLIIDSSAKENFLQIYTPPRDNTIAIEPTTGVSDSFNNKIGLQTLLPNEEYNITWNVNINSNKR